METFSEIALLVIVIVVYENFAKGSLADWARAKFFNAANPKVGQGLNAFGAAAAGALAPPASSSGGKQGIGNIGTGGGGLGAIGSLHRPVPGAIVSPFGQNRGDHLHAGVDLAANEGDPIGAAAAGRISARTSGGDCGNRIDIDHGGGLVTRYCHLSRFADVSVGSPVRAGQTIGYVGHTGDATGPHLHFEVRRNGVAVDPAPYLGGS